VTGLQCKRGEAVEILEARVERILAFLQQDKGLRHFHQGKRGGGMGLTPS
jgi:hypothetical protein